MNKTIVAMPLPSALDGEIIPPRAKRAVQERKPKPKRERFTDTMIAALRPPPGRKEITIFEAGRSGLGVRVQASGVKTFVFQKTQKDGERVRERLGPFPALTVEQARKRAYERVVALADGRDLRAERLAVEAEAKEEAERPKPLTLGELLAGWRAYLKAHKRRSYAVAAPNAAERLCQPFFGQPALALDKTFKGQLRQRLRDLGLKPAAARVSATSVIACLNWAVKQNLIEASPLAGFAAPERPPYRERKLTLAEMRRVYAAADTLAYPAGPLVKLLMLTGARRAEISGLRWDEVCDLDKPELAQIELAGLRTKTGAAHTIPLSSQARALLLACPTLATGADAKRSPYVFTYSGRGGVASWSEVKAKLVAAIGEPAIEDFRLHDFRRSLVSIMVAKPYSFGPIVLDRLLGHAPRALSPIAQIYQKAALIDERREALEAWGRALAGGEVVALPKRKRSRAA